MRKLILYFKGRYYIAALLLLSGCSIQKELSKNLFKPPDPALAHAFKGISLYDETKSSYVYEYEAQHLFTPASNTKLLTCYASFLHLPDSLPGWLVYDTTDTLFIKPNGDPTFLDPAFREQSFFTYLTQTHKPIVLLYDAEPSFSRKGSGWGWNSYQASYMPERSAMPIYGNLVRFIPRQGSIEVRPSYFQKYVKDGSSQTGQRIRVDRDEISNHFTANRSTYNRLVLPFTQTTAPDINFRLLQDTLSKIRPDIDFQWRASTEKKPFEPYFTQARDSVLKRMMHRSDNFIAEQLLLMNGSQITGKLADQAAIRSIVKNDLSFMDPAPRWADGSGLSRNNRISPHAIVQLLARMKAEIGAERLMDILPTGNDGTLSGLYVGLEQQIYGKTGTLSGDIALSGYLITDRGKPYIFSFLVNSHQSTDTEVRKAVEKFLSGIIHQY